MERSLAEVVRALAGGTMSRRQALAWMGATLAGAVLGRAPGASAAPAPGETAPSVPAQHGAVLRGIDLTQKDRSLEGRFGLMFKKLPSFEPPDELLKELARSMEELSEAAPGISSLPAGFVFLGQFLDHDLTFDNTSIPAQRMDPDAVTNFRAASFDLDSVYGPGPKQDAIIFDQHDPATLFIARNSNELDDLPRYPEDHPDEKLRGRARIGDPRDDENLVTSQLHLAFRKFHNRLVDYVRAQGLSRIDEVFAEAQRLCRWHYQWMVVHDFLPKMVGQDTVDKILEERSNGPAKVKLSYFKPKNPNKPMMPIEFAAAAYRFGHSMLPHKYEINENNRDVALFDEQDNKNLDGGREIPPDLVIDWRYFFVIPPRVNKARPIDSKLSPPLFELPKRIIPEPDKTLVSLAERNLLRGKRLGLASGQRVAQEMGATVLSNADLFKGLPPDLGNDPGWGGQAPLWFYILKEAQTQQNGVRLGEVGGRIVAEVFLGLLERDKSSYLHPSNKGFRPQAPPRGIAPADGQFGIVDLLKFAGVWTSD